MTTLISIHNHGAPTRTCDANCYNATSDVCTCCCGGRNHGAGLQVAIEQTRTWSQAIIAAYAPTDFTVRLHPSIAQTDIRELLDD